MATLSRNLLDRPRRMAETPLSSGRVHCWHSFGAPARWGPVSTIGRLDAGSSATDRAWPIVVHSAPLHKGRRY